MAAVSTASNGHKEVIHKLKPDMSRKTVMKTLTFLAKARSCEKLVQSNLRTISRSTRFMFFDVLYSDIEKILLNVLDGYVNTSSPLTGNNFKIFTLNESLPSVYSVQKIIKSVLHTWNKNVCFSTLLKKGFQTFILEP